MTFLLCNYILAQHVSVFQSLSIRDGLPSNYVFDAEEDSEGYLWIGTDKGLARYDGFSWQVYDTKHHLPGNYISHIFSDGNKGLWLVINTKGIYHFNIITNEFKFVTNQNLERYYQTDKDGNFFFYQYENRITNNLAGYWASPTNPEKLNMVFKEKGNSGTTIITDFKNKKIHITSKSTGSQICQIQHIKNGWELDTIKIPTYEPKIISPVNDNIFSSTESIYYMLNNNIINKIRIAFSDNAYLNVIRYQNQTIASTEKNGVFFIADNGNIKHYTEKDGLSSNFITGMHVLKNGKLLLCTLGGGICYKMPESSAMIDTKDVEVEGLSQNEKYIYATSGNILFRYDITSGTFDKYLLSEKKIQNINVWNDNIYISTLTGFSVYNIYKNKLIKQKTITKYAGISGVIEINRKIFAGSYGNHILEYSNDAFIKEDTTTLAVTEKIQAISGGIAAYNYEDGVQLAYFNGQRRTLSQKNGLPSDAVYHVHEHKDTLWISTQAGMSAYTEGKIVKNISFKDGLQGSRCIYSFHDIKGNFWIVTDKYLGNFDGKKVFTYTSVPIKNNPNDVITCCLYNKTSNTLITGCLRNIFSTNLNYIQPVGLPAQPQLQKISIDGEEYSDSNFRVPSGYRSLKISFSPYTVNPFASSGIYYKLTGRDNNFLLLKDSLSVNFNKLSSGKYQLIAKAKNDNDTESSEKVICSFTINKPLWQRNWFIALVVLSAGAVAHIMATINQRKVQRQKDKERGLEEKLNNERERISRELHDNLGTSLVTIIAQSDNIETRLRYNQTQDALKKVQDLSDRSRQTLEILRETVWAVRHESYTYHDFINRIRDFLQRTYSVTTIECKCVATGTLDKKLTPEQTLNIFRCIQECTQNIIKHSNATKSIFNFNVQDEHLSIIITDNGKGFDTKADYAGHGLTNITKRIAEMKGSTNITSSVKGTVINIKIKL